MSVINPYQKAKRVISRLLEAGKKQFIIFPYGENGGIVKRLLCESFGICDVVVFDNRLCKTNAKILPLHEIRKYNLDEYTVLLSSDTENGYSDIRKQLMEYVSINQFVDVFSRSMFWDADVFFEKPSFDHPRLIALETAAKEIYKRGVTGDIAEVGVYQGWFANHMSRLLPDRRLFLFDTFSGFDERDLVGDEIEDSSDFRSRRSFGDTSVDVALKNIGYRANAIVKKGYFPETANGFPDGKFAFVSLDTDLYKPIYAGLQFFFPRLSRGGFIFVDDLGHAKLSGVRKAVVDFCDENHIGYVPIYDGDDETAIITKG